MSFIFYTLLFFLGSVMGSFVGVIIERGRGGFEWKRLVEIFGGRSYCPWCGQTLTWWQLIPYLGWLAQRGKCFRCGLAIPKRYNWLEMTMWMVFVATAWCIVGDNLYGVFMSSIPREPLVFWLLVNWAFRGIIVADFLWYELNVYLWLFLIGWIVGRAAGWDFLNFEWMFAWGIVWIAIFGLIWRLSKLYIQRKFKTDGAGIGEGDVMLSLVIGFLFPFLIQNINPVSAIQLICVYLILSSALGIVFWLVRLGLDGNRNSMLPYLPAMIVAFWLLLGLAEYIMQLIQV